MRAREAMKRQRIAHIMPWDGVGGTEHGALRIARAVAEERFDTTFLCLGSAAIVRDFFEAAGFETGTWWPEYPGFNGYRSFIHESIRLAREFRRLRIDLVHCADVPAGAYAAFAAKLAFIPVVCHVRNRHTNIGEPEQHMLGAVNTFAFVSRSSWTAFGRRVSSSRGVVIYDGLDASAAGADRNDAVDVRREFAVPDDTTIVGMIARIDPQKDFETLARAARRLAAASAKVRFLIVGGHSVERAQRAHFEQVKQWLAENGVTAQFTFTDYRADVDRLLNAMDIVVLSTHYEGLPLVLLEAMAAGKPVVATAVDGVPEVITHDRTGLLVPHGDDERLASHLLSLVRDSRRAGELGIEARRFVAAHFNRQQFKRSVLDVYERLLRRNRLPALIAPKLGPVVEFACRTAAR